MCALDCRLLTSVYLFLHFQILSSLSPSSLRHCWFVIIIIILFFFVYVSFSPPSRVPHFSSHYRHRSVLCFCFSFFFRISLPLLIIIISITSSFSPRHPLLPIIPPIHLFRLPYPCSEFAGCFLGHFFLFFSFLLYYFSFFDSFCRCFFMGFCFKTYVCVFCKLC